MAAISLAFDILARDKASKNIKEVGDAAGRTSNHLGGLKRSLGGMAAAVAGAFAVKEVFSFGKGLYDAANESRKVTAQTSAVLKSMGNAAGVTADQVAGLSTKLSMTSGVDDELIQSGENILLTFGKVRNEVGKGNDIFNRASAAALDMSVALGTDMKGASIEVGKALNDPVKGVAALGRAGVSFTQKQKDTIKRLVETGDTLGAQKIILSELDNQFKGSAAAQATAGDKLKVIWGNLQEQLGAKLLPVIDKVASFLAKNLPGALDTAGRFFQPIIKNVGMFFKALSTGFTEDEGTGIERFAIAVRSAAGQVKYLFDILKNAFQAGDSFGLTGKDGLEGKAAVLGATLRKLFDFIRTHAKPILVGLGVAFVALTAPITGVVAALAYAYVKFDGFRAVVNGVVQFFTGTVIPAIKAVASAISNQFAQMSGYVSEHWGAIQEAIAHVVVAVQAIIDGFVAAVGAAWRMWGDNIMTVVRSVFGTVKTIVKAAVGILTGIIETAINVINGDWGKAWDSFKAIFSNAWDALFSILKTDVAAVVSIVSGIGESIGRIAPKMFDGLKTAFRAAVNFVIRGWNSLQFKIPGFDPPGPGPKFKGFTLGVPDIPTIHSGGFVTAMGIKPLKSDEMFGRLQFGETVLPKGTQLGGVGDEVHLHVTQYPGDASPIDAGMRALRHHRTITLAVASR